MLARPYTVQVLTCRCHQECSCPRCHTLRRQLVTTHRLEASFETARTPRQVLVANRWRRAKCQSQAGGRVDRVRTEGHQLSCRL
jgi:hypothetical protein